MKSLGILSHMFGSLKAFRDYLDVGSIIWLQLVEHINQYELVQTKEEEEGIKGTYDIIYFVNWYKTVIKWNNRRMKIIFFFFVII